MLTWILRYTERFQAQDDTRSSSEEIIRPFEDETVDLMQSLIPAENTRSRYRSSTALSRPSNPYQGRISHNLSIEDCLDNRGASLYEYNSSLENSSTTTNSHIQGANHLSSMSSSASFPQAVALTDSPSTAAYQTNSPPTTTITTFDTNSTSIHFNHGSSSSFTFDEVFNNNNNNNNSDLLDLSLFPQLRSFNMFTGSQPDNTFDQLFPSIDYGDALAYPAPCAAVHDKIVVGEQRTEPLPLSSSPRRQNGALGMLNMHTFSPRQQERYMPPELHPRSTKRRFIRRESPDAAVPSLFQNIK